MPRKRITDGAVARRRGKQGAEVRVGRYGDAFLLSRPLEYGRVVGGLVANVADMDRVVAGHAEPGREPRRQRVVDEEPQSCAVSGICLSFTAAAA